MLKMPVFTGLLCAPTYLVLPDCALYFYANYALHQEYIFYYVLLIAYNPFQRLTYYSSPVTICRGDGSTTVIVLEVGARVGEDVPGIVGRIDGAAMEYA